MKDKDKAGSDERSEEKFFFDAPWSDKGLPCYSGREMSVGTVERLLESRTRLHEIYIREEAKTARLTLVIGSLMFLCGSAAILFAPEKKEPLFHWMGAALLIVSAGVSGYKRVWAKSKVFEVRADRSDANK